MQTITINVAGRVQGVFFRQSTHSKALELGITGTVCNLPDGSVQIKATGTPEQLNALTEWCKDGPENATVITVKKQDEPLQQFEEFRILR